MIGVRPDRSMTFYDAIFNVSVVAYVNIIQNNGVLYVTAASNKRLLKDDGVLDPAVYKSSAGKQTVLHVGTHIKLCRRQIIYLGINIRILSEEIISGLSLQEIHVRVKIVIDACNIAPVILQLISINPLHILITN